MSIVTYWQQLGLDIDGEAAGDESGSSVSISSDGNVVAIGAFRNSNNRGHVRVFENTESGWVQRGDDIDGKEEGDLSGYKMSLSDDGLTVAIGSYVSGANGHRSGQVRVWRWNGSAWSQLGLDINGASSGDQSGSSVSLSQDGNIVAIGAHLHDGNKGHVRVFEWDGSSWSQRGSDLDGESSDDRFGFSSSLSPDGNYLAVGGFLNDGNGENYYGNANRGETGDICESWNSAFLSSILEPDKIQKLGDLNNNFCRNPDGDVAPWCIAPNGEFDYCDIPKCSDNENNQVQ